MATLQRLWKSTKREVRITSLKHIILTDTRVHVHIHGRNCVLNLWLSSILVCINPIQMFLLRKSTASFSIPACIAVRLGLCSLSDGSNCYDYILFWSYLQVNEIKLIPTWFLSPKGGLSSKRRAVEFYRKGIDEMETGLQINCDGEGMLYQLINLSNIIVPQIFPGCNFSSFFSWDPNCFKPF